ncbi:MAG: tetratricopeptide repeat protein [Candidatus Magnetominusculus sp. LBB02]|nr:tetratricopeptide repeat protein [Candidatus Magnetominusculus sp. LBB02]
MIRSSIISAALFMMTLGVFSEAGQFRFIHYDDNLFVVENPYIHDGLTKKGVIWAFTTPYTGTAVMPLAWLSHMLDITIYGLRPGGHHMSNILIHSANTVLLFSVLRLMTSSLWQSAFIAALFSLHPLHVETAAWISERKGLLSAFFWLGTMLFYIYYVKRTSYLRYLPVLLCFIASLLSKPIAIMLPAALLLMDYWPLGRTIDRRIVIEKIPMFLLSAVAGAFTYQVQKGWNRDDFFNVVPFSERLGNAFVSYAMYLYHTFVPVSLSPIYVFSDTLNITQAVCSAAVVVAVTAASIVFIKRMPYFFVGWFWYLALLLPVSGLAQVGYQSMADRYTYLPLIGVFTAVTAAISEKTRGIYRREVILSIGAAAILIACAIVSHRQAAYWRNDISLFGRAADATHDNFIAYYNLGSAYLNTGNEDEALAYYKKSIAIKPAYEKPYVSVGFVLLHKDMAHEASLYFTKAAALDPHDPAPVYGMGLTLMRSGRAEVAQDYFNKALSIDPNFAPAKELVN